MKKEKNVALVLCVFQMCLSNFSVYLKKMRVYSYLKKKNIFAKNLNIQFDGREPLLRNTFRICSSNPCSYLLLKKNPYKTIPGKPIFFIYFFLAHRNVRNARSFDGNLFVRGFIPLPSHPITRVRRVVKIRARSTWYRVRIPNG